MKYVYTDGACSNNGKSGGRAGYGIYFGDGDSRNVSKRVVDDYKQTNNVAEIIAVIESIYILGDNINEYVVYTDSNYVILCATTYGEKQALKGWKKDIPNKTLVKELYTLVSTKGVSLRHVEAHTGRDDQHSIGNREADKLAVGAIGGCNERVSVGVSVVNPKVWLNVPYCDKDRAKSLGAKWDPNKKKWWCGEGIKDRFVEWL